MGGVGTGLVMIPGGAAVNASSLASGYGTPCSAILPFGPYGYLNTSRRGRWTPAAAE